MRRGMTAWTTTAPGGRELLNPHTGYGSCDDQLLDLARSFEDRVDDFELFGECRTVDFGALCRPAGSPSSGGFAQL
jgi:hypothetical protein